MVGRLQVDLLSGKLEPGARLTLRELAGRYDAGTIPLREALSRLSTSGFITVEDQKGFRVAELSAEDVRDIHTLRTELECLAIREAFECGTAQWEGELISAHHVLARRQAELKGHPLANDPEWEDLHCKFHLQLVSASKSKWLKHFIKTLINHSSRYRQIASVMYPAATVGPKIAAEHEAILNAALKRDADLACALLTEHYRRTAQATADILNGARSSAKAIHE
ncbi:MAG: GntR family transcriptional regulator [Hyphomicrobiaceae bacterium]|nr:GntR family transcriptional regulator [Hyphomicrobiaceae bacterium]